MIVVVLVVVVVAVVVVGIVVMEVFCFNPFHVRSCLVLYFLW